MTTKTTTPRYSPARLRGFADGCRSTLRDDRHNGVDAAFYEAVISIAEQAARDAETLKAIREWADVRYAQVADAPTTDQCRFCQQIAYSNLRVVLDRLLAEGSH